MRFTRSFGLSWIVLAVLIAACGGGGTSTQAPASPRSSTPASDTPTASLAPESTEPSSAPTAGISVPPGASLDPTQSDAGIAARVTITNDTRAGRDGTYDIYGLDEDGSECSGAFEDDYLVVAWYDDAPDDQLRRFSVSVEKEDIPAEDGSTTAITHGGVSFDFAGAIMGSGVTYTGNSTVENEGSSTIDVTRSGVSLTFDFEAVTRDGVNFSGQLICADAT